MWTEFTGANYARWGLGDASGLPRYSDAGAERSLSMAGVRIFVRSPARFRHHC
jgi:hypothetical protein